MEYVSRFNNFTPCFFRLFQTLFIFLCHLEQHFMVISEKIWKFQTVFNFREVENILISTWFQERSLFQAFQFQNFLKEIFDSSNIKEWSFIYGIFKENLKYML